MSAPKQTCGASVVYPLPPESLYNVSCICVIRVPREDLAICRMEDRITDEQQAFYTPQMIVVALNNHAALVDALKDLIARHDSEKLSGIKMLSAHFKPARALLAKIDSEKEKP